MTRRYIKALSVPKSIGTGRFLMHNHVRHSRTMPSGMSGFRAWTDVKRLPGFRRCHCGWSGLPHYSRFPSYKCEPMSRLPK